MWGGGERGYWHAHNYYPIYNKAKWPHSLTHLYDLFIALLVTGPQTSPRLFYSNFDINLSEHFWKFQIFCKLSRRRTKDASCSSLSYLVCVFLYFRSRSADFSFDNEFIMGKTTFHVFCIQVFFHSLTKWIVQTMFFSVGNIKSFVAELAKL